MDSSDAQQSKWDQGSRPSLASNLVVICLLLFLGYFVLMPSTCHHHRGSSPVVAEIKNLEAAIQQYEATYGRWPFAVDALGDGQDNITFGTYRTSMSALGITNPSGYQANNSELMAVIMDLDSSINSNHFLNPGRHTFFSPWKITSETNSPGFGSDGVFRDPWGSPYIITISTKTNGRARDPFYRLASVSEKKPDSQFGLKDLIRPSPPPYTAENRDSFESRSTIMIWSLGPDRRADQSQKADEGVNKDNILSWQKN